MVTKIFFCFFFLAQVVEFSYFIKCIHFTSRVILAFCYLFVNVIMLACRKQIRKVIFTRHAHLLLLNTVAQCLKVTTRGQISASVLHGHRWEAVGFQLQLCGVIFKSEIISFLNWGVATQKWLAELFFLGGESRMCGQFLQDIQFNSITSIINLLEMIESGLAWNKFVELRLHDKVKNVGGGTAPVENHRSSGSWSIYSSVVLIHCDVIRKPWLCCN